MRVLFVANPEKAHLLAMVPLAWALRAAGHEVRVAGQPAFADVITQAGLTAVPVGRDGDLWRLLARDPRLPGWTWRPAYGLPAPYDVAQFPGRGTWEHLTEGYAEVLRHWHRPGCLPMIAALTEFARHWRPDLVVWEPLAFAGPIAARACGAAHARLLWSLDVFGLTRARFLDLKAGRPEHDRADPLAEWLDGYARRHGGDFAEDMVTGQFTIDQVPDSIAVRAPGLHHVPVRYLPHGGPSVVPGWLREPPRRPRVALTMGVSLTDHAAGYSVSVRDLLEALADLDVEVVATIADAERHGLATVPGNARVVPYVPLQALAATCSAVLSHGGFGTVLTTAGHGVPQLAMPWDFDGPLFARRLAAQGAALAVDADRVSGETVRAAVLRLLEEPAFAKRADDLRAELAALPSPGQLVARLEELTERNR
ncbi:activator-dependent family glycosyltransferase [Herbidospora yilanensis]|uniref:activator-dependent family glycosyltransferase n=1 Tax=Herbidospora yilanensis TaxID=354426 RepID=UPI000783662A|nr:activator-dependent family glycosyltransferase [Herbidospora yilanensis]